MIVDPPALHLAEVHVVDGAHRGEPLAVYEMNADGTACAAGLCVAGELRHTSGEVIYLHKTAP